MTTHDGMPVAGLCGQSDYLAQRARDLIAEIERLKKSEAALRAEVNCLTHHAKIQFGRVEFYFNAWRAERENFAAACRLLRKKMGRAEPLDYASLGKEQ